MSAKFSHFPAFPLSEQIQAEEASKGIRRGGSLSPSASTGSSSAASRSSSVGAKGLRGEAFYEDGGSSSGGSAGKKSSSSSGRRGSSPAWPTLFKRKDQASGKS